MTYDGVKPPLTYKQAADLVTDEFILALKNRPTDWAFCSKGRHIVKDRLSGAMFWVANEVYGFAPGDGPMNTGSQPDLGWWNRRRAFRAFRKWENLWSPGGLQDHHDILIRIGMALRCANHPNKEGT